MSKPRPAAQPHTLHLTLRPPGRGNWHPVRVTITGHHAPLPLYLHPGAVVVIGDTRLRVVNVST